MRGRSATGILKSRRTKETRGAALSAALVVAIELLSFLSGGLASIQSHSPVAVATPAAGSGSEEATESAQLGAAETTLEEGAGPADGAPLDCAGVAVAGASIDCGVTPPTSSPKPLVTTTPSWTREEQPAVRASFGLTYDVRDKYVLLFGGEGSSAVLGDTWKYSGGLWTQLHPATSPSARYGAVMAFDTADNYVVLYGGYSGSAGLSDTWKFVAGTWTKLSPTTNPGALLFGMLSNDPRDGYLVYFGGETSASVVQGLTWEFKAGQWTKLSPTKSPSARESSVMDYDMASGYVVLFGGLSSTFVAQGDTWNFTGGQWTKMSPSTSPSARYDSAMGNSAKDSELVLFGGYAASGYVSDTWTFVAGTWTKISERTHPSSRTSEAADGTNSTDLILFGGEDSHLVLTNDTWTFSGIVWTHAIPRTPSFRDSAAMTYDEADGYVLLFGGSYNGSSSSALGDTWKFLHGIWTPLHPLRSPSARLGAAMTYDPADACVVLFGGIGASGNDLNDTWTFAGGSWTESSPVSEAPTARAFASMTYDDADGYVLLFGGRNFTTLAVLNDTWGYSAGVWTPIATASAPAPCFQPDMAYDSEDGYVVLFSGATVTTAGFTTFPDTWTYSAGLWTNITDPSAVSPPGDYGGRMVDDTYDGYLLLFGGDNLTGPAVLGETWSFVNGAWSEQFPAVNPGAQAYFGMAFDPPDNEVVLLSTYTPYTPVTWTY